ncbi:MAG: hypothetical protein ACQER5_04580 [Pseudomonadota bacterium]
MLLMSGPAVAWHGAADDRQGWALGLHGGRAIDQSVQDGTAFDPFGWDFQDYSLTSLGLRKDLMPLGRHLRLFSELHVAWVSGDEEYGEVAFTPTLSWESFPWDHALDTRALVGAGLSYTTKSTQIDDVDGRLLASMIFELEVQPAPWESWSIYTRLHHRSNAFGLFGDDSDSRGSNFPSLGVRYHW